MKIQDFINGVVTYDKFGGQYFWIADPNGGQQMLAELRGWGHIQNMFKAKDETIDEKAAGEFQDLVGDFIAAAINEKLERERLAEPVVADHDLMWLTATAYRGPKNATDKRWIAAFAEYNEDIKGKGHFLPMTCAPCYAKVTQHLRQKHGR